MLKSRVNTPVKGPKFSVMKNIIGACMMAAQSARRISVADCTLKRKNEMSRNNRPTIKLLTESERKENYKHVNDFKHGFKKVPETSEVQC
jgi:hypothetical protein